MISHLRSAWRYRNFILSAIKGELKGRFAASKIGTLWFVLHPLAMATIYAVVLSKVLGAKLGGVSGDSAYSIYLMAGIAAWTVFLEITNRCLTVFIEYGNTLKKISFPRIALPIIVLGSVLVTHALLLVAIAVVFVFFQHYPSIHWIALPVGTLVIALLAFGLGILLGVMNVFARDIGQVMSVVFQLWFWLTPIVYTRDILPDSMQTLIRLNPVTPLVEFYQDILLYSRWPDFASLLYPASLGAALVLASLLVFRRASAELVDAL
ncbi:MAG: ABC transporter permease [Hyphomonas sp.]|uniref:ABC transporter permease n=1 Tax=Hyphomonas sp. TaxID=87 RepID=UPI003263E422